MFKKFSILRAPKRVLQAALVCESDSLPLASQKAADSFSSSCSFFEATEPAFEASEAAHAQHCFFEATEPAFEASEAAHALHCFRSRESWTFAPDRRSLLSSLASVRN